MEITLYYFKIPFWRAEVTRLTLFIGDIPFKDYRVEGKEIDNLNSRFKNGNITEENYEIYGRDIGDKIFLDTSCEIPLRLHQAGLSGVALPLISPRIDKAKIKFMTEAMRGEEHHLNGVPIFTHLGRSLSRHFELNPEAVLWRNRVNEWLKNI